MLDGGLELVFNGLFVSRILFKEMKSDGVFVCLILNVISQC